MLPRLIAVVIAAFAVSGSTAYAERYEMTNSHSISFVSAHVNAVLRKKCLATYLPGRVGFETLVRRHLLAHRAKSQCSRWTVADTDFHRALRLATSTFGVSYTWLHACDHSEGSDRMVWNNSGSGAFGPMQFMKGTFYGNVGSAFAAARARGLHVPWTYARWDSNVGQAFTAAYMFHRWGSSGWTGSGC